MFRVLVVETDPERRRSLQRELAQADDFSAFEVSTVGAALELLKQDPDIGAVVGGAAALLPERPGCVRVDSPPGGVVAAVRQAIAASPRRTLPYGVGPPAAPPLQPAAQATLTFQVGDVLSGVYRLTGSLGSGSLAQVFEAVDELVQRAVAIKVPHPGANFPIRAEAQAMAAVRHSCVPMVYAVGNHRGVEYLAMERIQGATLYAHLEQRARFGQRFTISEALDLLIALAEGLAAVHSAGIAHRDVSSSNVIVAPGNRVVLLDLGIFLPQSAVPSELVSGTPIYMAPEVAASRVSRGAGHLVDAYALGIIAWELLTGEPPFQGTLVQVLQQHLSAPLPDLRALRSDLPGPLAALVLELLAKDPAERPQALDQVGATLRAMRAEPVDPRNRTPVRVPEPLHVVVVDDNRFAQRAISAVVKAVFPDARVQAVADAEAGLQRVRERVPDLLIVDQHLPGMSGFELCMFLRGTHLADRCTVIAVSGAVVDEDVKVLRQLGVRFASKQEDLGDLRNLLVEVFGRRARP